ncbi:MAG TPA: sugar ABC transporter permease [Thermotogota bacterium]|nr:sugar ABC transporter permease [Thermotogota bacterium]HRW92130.1 sugar ABC transporter permease [Thermotogota bacterium]
MAERNVLTRYSKRFWKETIQAYLFLLPSFVILGVFVFWPIFYSFVLSFFKWDFSNQRNPYFNGITNYTKLFKLDMALPYSFWTAVGYSLLYLVLGLFFARVIGLWIQSRRYSDHASECLAKKIPLYLLVLAALFVLSFVFAKIQVVVLLFLLSAAIVAGLVWIKRTVNIRPTLGLWGSTFIVVGVYLLMLLVTGVRFELLDFLTVTKESSVFVKAIYNTLYYVLLTTPTQIVISLCIALLLNVPLKAKAFYRTSYFIPYVTSVVAISLVWRWIFNDEYGLLNYFLSFFGSDRVKWLTDERWTIPTIAVVSVWKSVGYNAIIFLAGLQSIDKFYYEAAEVDGASPGQKFRHITWPLLSPTTFFVLIVSVIANFKVFTQIFVLYQGLPGPYNNSGMTMVYYIFDKFYDQQQMGEASAAAYVLFMIIMVLTFFQFRVGQQRVKYTS